MARNNRSTSALQEYARRRYGGRYLVEELTVRAFDEMTESLFARPLTPFDAASLYGSIVSLIESALRDCVRDRINHLESPEIELPTIIKNSRLDIQHYLGLREHHFSIGDIVSHSFNVSSIETADALLSFCFEYNTPEKVFDSDEFRLLHPGAAHLFERPFYEMHIGTANCFTARHRLVHELSDVMFVEFTQRQQEIKDQIRWDIQRATLFLRVVLSLRKDTFASSPDVDHPVHGEIAEELQRVQENIRVHRERLETMLAEERWNTCLNHLFEAFEAYAQAASEFAYFTFHPGTMASSAALARRLELANQFKSDLDRYLSDMETMNG